MRNSITKEPSCYMHNQQIDNIESFKHLGHVISSKMEDASDIICRRNDFVGQVNSLLCYFRKLTSCVKYRFFRSYCPSFMAASCGHLLPTSYKISVLHDAQACVQSETYHNPHIVIATFNLYLFACI